MLLPTDEPGRGLSHQEANTGPFSSVVDREEYVLSLLPSKSEKKSQRPLIPGDPPPPRYRITAACSRYQNIIPGIKIVPGIKIMIQLPDQRYSHPPANSLLCISNANHKGSGYAGKMPF